ncbi:30S ribosomal protein S3 [Williamsoniiplasma luminosum]|uniref:Small ribosomal subunit protein uS3 n=1 Tax=Williamsoniiplasma luminosum TaxID=214888 RepID=A0A2K8NT96_9MOLU|nr:30S ribosomal protein S3 [Williamsoniiplasma luminosum]ATZ17009.1 30S ribosomal protein S3 [Williamsoniiplasma luminosum]AVP49674.1 MAG: 30S ribosomal protein S3 [Williamsoniiplasma luminosum]
MGQKVSPNALRLGIVRQWEGRWYAEKGQYVQWLNNDIKIRETLLKMLNNAAVAKIDIERTQKDIKLIIKSARPVIVMGENNKRLEDITLAVRKIEKNRQAVVNIKVVAIDNPDGNATLIARWIGEQITNRASFRTVQKVAIRRALKAHGVKGIKTTVSGRLGGVEMARTEGYLEGSVPLATLRSNIDYALYEAKTTYGQIGVKVWVNHGEVFEKNTLAIDEKPAHVEKKWANKGGRR